MKKTIYLLKLMVALVLLSLATTAGARTTYFISASGSDANSGLSEDQAVKTFAKALEVAADNDDIQVIGDISMPANVTVEKRVRIFGDGKNKITTAASTGCFTIQLGSLDTDSLVVFQDLEFNGCRNTQGGGVIAITSGRVHFSNCFFKGNYSDERGGVMDARGDNTWVSFYNCKLEDNTSDKAGATFYATENARLDVQFCSFTNNLGLGKGGCFRFEGGVNAHFYATDLYKNGTAHIPLADRITGTDKQEDGGGGLGWITGKEGTYTFQSCAITHNKANGNHGGAFILEGENAFNFINTTIAENTNGGRDEKHPSTDGYSDGGTGCLWVLGGDLTFVNVTMARNQTGWENNGGNGAGVTMQNSDTKFLTFNVYNSIIVGNMAYGGGGTPNGVCDIVVRRVPADPDPDKVSCAINIKNSVIGYIHNGNGSRWLPEEIPTTFNVDNVSLYQQYEYEAGYNWSSDDQSGIFTDYGLTVPDAGGMGCYVFEHDGVYAATLGDPDLLGEWDADNDQYLKPRTVTGGKIWAGAIQGYVDWGLEPINPVAPVDLVVTEWVESGSGIALPTANVTLSASVISDGLLMVNFGALVGKAKGELFTINGQLAQVVFDGQVSGVGYYPVDRLAAGFYTLKVSLDGKTYAVKLIVK